MAANRIVLLASIFFLIVVIFQSCYNDATLVIDNSPAITKTVSFSSDIIPILSKTCSISGCHNTGGQTPDLTSAKAFSSLTIGGFITTATPDQSVLYLYLIGKKTPEMPLGSANNPSNINQLVLAWIQQGAKNN